MSRRPDVYAIAVYPQIDAVVLNNGTTTDLINWLDDDLEPVLIKEHRRFVRFEYRNRFCCTEIEGVQMLRLH